jgi:murein DD-endopeptidase MepM/ murein hydrolase activator NlpD
MDKEIPISDYINQNELEIDNSTESSSSSSTNSIVSLSTSISSLSINSQSTSTSSDTKSSTNSVDNISNLSSVSSKSISYISSSSEVQSVSYISTNNTNSSSSQSISFLDIFLGLGGVRIDAATNDGWRLPYQAGQKPELRSRPYDPTVPTHTQYAAFDFGSANNIIVAGKSGKVIYIAALTSGFGNHMVIQSDDGSLAIYAHLSSFNVGLNADVTRGQQIGVEGTTGNSSGQHLHFETMAYTPCSNGGQTCWGSVEYKSAQMIPQFDECYTERGGKSTTVVNCSNGYPYTWWKFFESINSSTPTGGFIKSYTNNNMLFDIVAFNYTDQAQVTLYNYNGGYPNQRWYYNSSDETIRNPISGRCLDSGDVNNSSNRWLRINWCNGGWNQKWIRASDKTLRTRANENLCVDSANGNTNGSYLYLYNCNGQWNQQFGTDDMAYSGGYSANPMYETDKTFNFGSQILGSYTNPGMVFDVDRMIPLNEQPIKLWYKSGSGNNAQRWYFDWNTKQLKGLNDKCIDAGDVNNINNRWLRIYTCHSGNNQKWFADQFSRIHSYANDNLCVDSQSGNAAGSILKMADCHTLANQNWGGSTIGMELRNWYPPYANRFAFRRRGTNKCIDAYQPYNERKLYAFECAYSYSNHQWDWVGTGYNNGAMMRQANTNFCIDGYPRFSDKTAYTFQCTPSASNHNWYYNGTTGLIQQQNTNQCLDVYNPKDNDPIYSWQCDPNDIHQQWDAIRIQ